jgi:gamma-glutamyltranspeptidase / glutathione hydrolase
MSTPSSLDPDSHDTELPPSLHFTSRRSPVLCRHACVASSQPLASHIGLQLLHQGANAAEAAIAVAAALAVTEPCSTGVGGDMFCVYYNASTQQVTCVNGSGPSPALLTRDMVLQAYPSADTNNEIDAQAFRESPHAITVPGAVQGWHDTLERYGSGKFTLAQLLEPAAQLAEEGFPVAPITAYHWQQGLSQITKWYTNSNDDTNSKNASDSQNPSFTPPQPQTHIPLTMDGQRAPRAGEVFTNPDLARVLREIGTLGVRHGFYEGATGRAIVDAIQQQGGCMTCNDLTAYTASTFPTPIAADYRDCRLWQVPPNGQGIAACMALTGLQHLERTGQIVPLSHESIGTADCYHVLMELMRLGFQDGRKHVGDADHMQVTSEWLLDPERIGQRVDELFTMQEARIHGCPEATSCTVSFQVVDTYGNAISFVNSNFWGFGSGLVPEGCGFTLQNRGFGFTLEEGHVNTIGPSKRPYHTIIPGMLTHVDTGELYATLSNMGGHMQPQGHLQLTVSLVAGDLDPQAALDLPRFCILDGFHHGVCYLEDGIPKEVVEELKRRGHKLHPYVSGHERSAFGRAQIIKRDRTTGVLWAGSDGRADGCAMGF